VTVKFIWINWLGNSVGTMMKARLSTQLGAVKEFMGQSHVSHTCNSQNEISTVIIREKVMSTSGTGSSTRALLPTPHVGMLKLSLLDLVVVVEVSSMLFPWLIISALVVPLVRPTGRLKLAQSQ